MKLKPLIRICAQATAVLVLGTACGPKTAEPQPAAPTNSVATNATVEVQGEAIRGEPIAVPVPVPDRESVVAGADAASVPGSNAVVSVTSGAQAGEAAASGLIPTSPMGYAVASAAPTNVEPGYTGIGFDTLSGYEFDLTDDLLLAPPDKEAEAEEKTRAQIPKKIQELDGTKAAVMGFMLPLKVSPESGLVTEFLIMRDQSACCYGSVPKINEWISVTMTDKGVRPMMDQPVTIYGQLKVGPTRENGYLVGIYRLDGEKMAGPQDM